MIRIRGTEGVQDTANKIYFEPRAGFTRGRGVAPSLEFPLIYGHRCSYCGNVIQALFKAPRTFSLWPYEETVLLSQGETNAGEIRRIYPDEKTRFGKSFYHMDYSPAEGGSIKMTLKNHVMRFSVISKRQFNGEGLWESGGSPCMKTGIFSIRKDLLLKDLMLFGLFIEQEIKKYNLPPIDVIINDEDPNFKLVPAVGVAPPVVIVDRQSLVYGFHYQLRSKLTAHKKPGVS